MICYNVGDEMGFLCDLKYHVLRILLHFMSQKLSMRIKKKKLLRLKTRERRRTNENVFIQSEIYKKSLSISKRNDKILYYDCTNYFFEIEQEDRLKQYGPSKEHRPNPI